MCAKLQYVLLFLFMRGSLCVRRVNNGSPSGWDHNYLVYFVRMEDFPSDDDHWICHGAILTELFILTSAACVIDVKWMYAIGGYKLYVPAYDINYDECTNAAKRKVVRACYPYKYSFVKKWSHVDIALARIEKPFAETVLKGCSWVPSPMNITFDKIYTHGVFYSWGHDKVWRKPGDYSNYNSKVIKWTQVFVWPKKICQIFYPGVLDEFHFCGASTRDPYEYKSSRRQENHSNDTLISEKHERISKDYDEDLMSKNMSSLFLIKTRRAEGGICQNDHGGPLWAPPTNVNSERFVFGVATMFRVVKDQCREPSVFINITKFKNFIQCTLREGLKARRNPVCDLPPSERGYGVVVVNLTHTTWENELISELYPDESKTNTSSNSIQTIEI